jgi:prepilin-type N-terminal cleavage/methylation domain-containing protein
MQNNQDEGFTLVELLIVIVILGILATVTVFAVRGITDKGQENACSVEVRTLDTAVEAYYAQNQSDALMVEAAAADDAGTSWDDTDATLALSPAYLKSAPDDTKFAFVGGAGADGDLATTADNVAAAFSVVLLGPCDPA